MKPWIILSLAVLAGGAQAGMLYSNGPAVDSNGLSVLQAPAFTLGFGAQTKSNNAVADDFTVSGGIWSISSFDFYAYQNNARDFSLQTATWSIVAGDLHSGSLIASGTTALTNAGLVGYRVNATDLGNTTKPIFRANADIADILLDEGHYWLRWSFTGSLSSGPWQEPTSDARVGNAAQSLAGGSFNTLVDAGSQRTVDLPFALNGSIVSSVPEPSTPALMLVAGLALFGTARLRKR